MLNDKPYEIVPGDTVYIEPKETHDIINDGTEDLKIFFIKCPFKPEDKVNCK
jgi:mannose-6-phosphate isomerase-like protein (cupin superfamily)